MCVLNITGSKAEIAVTLTTGEVSHAWGIGEAPRACVPRIYFPGRGTDLADVGGDSAREMQLIIEQSA